jgi:hypothetical protein
VASIAEYANFGILRSADQVANRVFTTS